MGNHRPLRFGLTSLFALLSFSASAQSPRTISYQGFLTDDSGVVVADASRNMTFKMYPVEVGGSSLWTETQSVATVAGIFRVILGSVTPLSGFDFDQELWLGVAVGADSEMPRTRLTAAPLALALATPYPDTVLIETADLGSDQSERTNEDLTIYANDAVLALYSDAAGAAGSAITMGQISGGGLLDDRWSIFRRTKSAAAGLRFTYGAANYADSPTRVEFDTTGNVIAKGFKYSPSKQSYASIGPEAFQPIVSGTAGFRTTSGYSESGGPSQVVGSIQLPHGASLTSFQCTIYDISVSTELTCKLYAAGNDLSSGTEIGSVTTSGNGGFQSPSTSVSHTVNNSTRTYYVFAEVPSWGTVTDSIRIRRIIVGYEMTEVP